jgi:hypothetical protein
MVVYFSEAMYCLMTSWILVFYFCFLVYLISCHLYLLIWCYIPFWALAYLITAFQLSLFCDFFHQVVSFKILISCDTPSNHPNSYLPFCLLTCRWKKLISCRANFRPSFWYTLATSVSLVFIQYHYYRHNATHQSYMYIFLFLFTTCFGLSRPSSGVSSHAKTAILYWMTFLFLVSYSLVTMQSHFTDTQ